MTEPAAQPAPPHRPWRPMAAWTAGILLALGLAWFVGAVAVPIWRCRSVVAEQEPQWLWAEGVKLFDSQGVTHTWGSSASQSESQSGAYFKGARGAVEELGGPRRASHTLGLYLRLPERVAPLKPTAIWILGACGSSAVPVLEGALRHEDASVRGAAADVLKLIRAKEPPK